MTLDVKFRTQSVAGKKLDEYLTSRRETRGVFADRMCVTDGCVSHWITGRTKPSAATRRVIAFATNILAEEWDIPANPTPLEEQVIKFEAAETARRRRFDESMAVFRAAIEARRQARQEIRNFSTEEV